MRTRKKIKLGVGMKEGMGIMVRVANRGPNEGRRPGDKSPTLLSPRP